MLWLLLLALAAGADTNLLQNPGFEQTSSGLPDGWDLFVKDYGPLKKTTAPARGSIDTAAHDGAWCALLHNPVAYRTEPCNNWSQTVFGDLAGKKLRLSGAIKTEEATSAALWVQCWQRTPYKLLSLTTSSDRAPVTGTTGWRLVEVTLDVPEETSFVMVRCVLRGKGKAWFDALSLTEALEPPKQDALKPEHPQTIPIPTPKTNETPDIRELRSVAESLKSYSESNQALLHQVETLQQEIQALRGQLKSLQDAAAAVQPGRPEPAPETPQKRVPPLVPHGFNLKELP